VHFNQPMDPESAVFPLRASPSVEGEYQWSDGYATLTFIPEYNLRPLTPYWFRLAEELLSTAGERFDEVYSWQLKVIRSPRYTRTSQPPNAFLLEFSQPMDQKSVESALSVKPETAVNFNWEDQSVLVSFEPTIPGQVYSFVLTRTAMTKTGVSLQDQSWSYKTDEPQAVFSRGAIEDRLSPFIFEFDFQMDTESVEQNFGVTPPFDYVTSWENDGKRFLIQPTSPLPFGTLIEFSLDASTRTTLDFHLGPPYTWDYAVPDLDAIFEGSTLDRQTVMTLTLNIKMEPVSAENAMRVQPSFDYTLKWSDDNMVMSIIPDAPLNLSSTYKISFIGVVLGTDGYPVEGLGVYAYTTPGPITNESPNEYRWTRRSSYYGPEITHPEDGIVIEFDRPMDPVTTLGALSIDPPVDGTMIWEDQRTLVISPTHGFLPEYTEYTLVLAPSVSDESGDLTLTHPYTWTVLTGNLPNLASFGDMGADVQVLDLNGRRAIQIAVGDGLEEIHLELHRITIQQLIDFQVNTYDVPWVYGRAKPPYDISRSPLQAAWDSEVKYAPGKNYYNDVAEVFVPEEISEGLYVLNLITDHLDDQLILIASRSTIAVKYAPRSNGGGQLLAWVNDINDFVMQEAEVRVYDVNGQQIARGFTDEIGTYETNLPEGTEPYLVVARRDGGITAAGISNVWKTRGNLWRIPKTDTPNTFFAYVYTDRPIYRPGQDVHFKGVVRYEDDAAFSLPDAGSQVSLQVRDSRNNLVKEDVVELSDFGTFSGTFKISDGAALGVYPITIQIDGEYQGGIFHVEDYEKPDIEVNVFSDRDSYLLGEPISVTVDVDYLFGEPVADASLAAKLYLLRKVYGSDEYSWDFKFEKSQTLLTDQNGRAVLLLQNRFRELLKYQPNETLWAVEITADDGSNQQVSAFTTFKLYKNSSDVRLELGGYLYDPGKPIPVTAVYESHFSDPVAGQLLKLEIQRGRSYVDQTLELITDEAGVAHIEVEIPNGWYRLRLTGRDGQGEEIEAEDSVYVYDFASTWLLDYTTELGWIDQERAYCPGETAELTIQSSFDGEGLLTIERGGILDQRMIKLESPFTVINIPIKAGYAPNIFVNIQAWSDDLSDIQQTEYSYESIPDSILRWDILELNVKDIDHKLAVEVTPEKESYAPGDTAVFKIQVLNSSRKPVQAEVSFALVDESIFLLKDDPNGDIHDAFYQPRKLAMKYYDSLAPWRFLYLQEGDRGGGGDGYNPIPPRFDFPDTALWIPSVVTDSDGIARVEVTLPDTLTAWRLTAKAVTRDTLIGEGEANISTQQTVVLRPLPPRTVVEGDGFMLSTMVHNYSDTALDLTVSIEAEGIAFQEGVDLPFSLGPGEMGVASWNAVAHESGDATFIVRAVSPEGLGDAVQMGIPVKALALPELHTVSGKFTGEVSMAFAPVLNPRPESSIRLQVSSSIAEDLLKGIESLSGFPYGCVEQTMSRALPNAVIARAYKELGKEEKLASLQIEEKISLSLQRLYGYQHGDGGWGWFYDDPSTAYQTAWVIFGLATMAEAGYPVDPRVIENGADYLNKHLDEMDPRTQAFALYALTIAGYGDLGLLVELKESQDELDGFSQAALSLALIEMGEVGQAQAVFDNLMDLTSVDPAQGVYIQGDDYDGYYNKKFMSSKVRTTAMVLRVMLALQTENDYAAGMVNWLQEQRVLGVYGGVTYFYGWGSTNETAFTILALTDYILEQQESFEDSDVDVYLNGNILGSETLSADKDSFSIQIPLNQVVATENQIGIKTDSETPLYYLLDSRMYLEQKEIEAAGILVRRDYLDPETKQPLSEIKVGDLVLVRLRINLSETGFYLLLEDHLPGGLEALNEGLNSTSRSFFPEDYYYQEYYRDYFSYDILGYNQKEIWADRVVFFMTELQEKAHTYTYYARATVPGEFTALPAEISAMYDDTFWGRSESVVLEIIGD